MAESAKKTAALDGTHEEKHPMLAHLLLSCSEIWVFIMTGTDCETLAKILGYGRDDNL